MVNWKAFLQTYINLVLMFTHSDSVPRWNWGSFAQIESTGSALCKKGYCTERWKCPDHLVILSVSKACTEKSRGPWVCCEDKAEVSTQMKNTVKSELPQFTSQNEEVLPVDPFFVTPDVVLLSQSSKHLQNKGQNNLKSPNIYPKSSITEDNFSVDNSTESLERINVVSSEESLSNKADDSTQKDVLSDYRKNEKNSTSTRKSANLQHFDHQEENRFNTRWGGSWQENQLSEKSEYSDNSYREKYITEDEENEYLRPGFDSNGPWTSKTNARSKTTYPRKETLTTNYQYKPNQISKNHVPSALSVNKTKAGSFNPADNLRKTTESSWNNENFSKHSFNYQDNTQIRNTRFREQKTTSSSRIVPMTYSTRSTRRTTRVWDFDKADTSKTQTKSSWVNEGFTKDSHFHLDNKRTSSNQRGSTPYREHKPTSNSWVNPSNSYSSIPTRKTTRTWNNQMQQSSRKTTRLSWVNENSSNNPHIHWDNKPASNNQEGNTQPRERKTTSNTWIKPSKSLIDVVETARKTTSAWDIDKAVTSRKTTKPLLDKGGYSKNSRSTSSPVRSKTTPISRDQVTKISFIQDSNDEYSKSSRRYSKTTPNSTRKTTPYLNGQHGSKTSNKPTKVSLIRESSTNSKRSSTETWTVRNFPKSTSSSLSKHTPARTTQPTKTVIFSTRKNTPASSIVNSMRERSSSKQTTKMITNNKRTASNKFITTTPLPDISSFTCGIRDRDTVSERRRMDQPIRPYDDSESVIIYPDSRESTVERKSFQRIVGGKEAKPFSWPWVAALYKVTSSGGKRFLCAGSLINENFVMTAAHVFTPEDLRSSSFVVMLGTHTAKEALAEYIVMYVLQHPKYEQRYYYNDIALLRLDKPVRFNDYVMPVCLPSPYVPLFRDEDLLGKKVTVMGWGDESFGGSTSRVLKEATFPILSRKTCNVSYFQVVSNRFPHGITHEMLCAGSPNGGKDACQGDSGGPLTTIEQGRYTQVGIVSFGYRCGDKDYPGVYTKVSPYLSWIAENARCERFDDHNFDYYSRDY